jgi:hypothetical protein
MEQNAAHPREDRTLRWCAALAYLVSAFVPMAWLDRAPTLCPFRLLTGYPCPGCGGTHAFVALAHGQFGAAWAYNPLAVVIFFLGLAWLIAAFANPSGGRPRLSPRATGWAAVAFFVVAVAFGALRIVFG